MIEKDTLFFAVFIIFAGFFLYLICKIVKRTWELFGSILALLAVVFVWYLSVQVARSQTFGLHSITNLITYEYLLNLSETVLNRDYHSPIHESTQKPAHHINNIYSLISTVKRRWSDLYNNG